MLAVALFVLGVPAGVAVNRFADRFARTRVEVRRRTRVPGRGPAVLVAAPLLCAGCALAFGLHVRVAVAVAFCLVLVQLAAIDLEQRLVPNRIVLPAAAVVIAAQTAIDPSVEWAAAALAAAALFLVAALLYPAGMGMGDVKLMLLLGGMLGRSIPVAIAVGLLATLAPASVVLVRHGVRRGRKHALPLVPFLAVGAVVALFAGRSVLHAYLHL